MSNIRKIRAVYRIVTPMFLGGADREAERIRGSSFKGALAFWWRAFHFGRFVSQAGGNGDDKNIGQALAGMRNREQALFGSSDKGQGVFLLRIVPTRLNIAAEGEILAGQEVGMRYLGYGAMVAFGPRAGSLERSCIREGQEFTVELLFRPDAADRDMGEIAMALKLLGLLGGLGGRVRRGFGSLALQSLEGAGQDWQAPADRKAYEGELKRLFGGDHAGLRQSGRNWPLSAFAQEIGRNWPLSAFAQESGIWIGQPKPEKSGQNKGGQNKGKGAGGKGAGFAMLDSLGRAFVRYRGWGHKGKFGNLSVMQQFREDHDWFKKGSNDVDIPYRTAFGLPHMYGKGEGVEPADTGRESGGVDRRASPMLMHIHEWNGQAAAVITLLPTKFLDIEVHARRNQGSDACRSYDLYRPYGRRRAAGMDVLKDFLAAGKGEFKPNDLVSFGKVLP